MDNIILGNAIRCVEDARRELVSLYLPLDAADPGYEVAVAEHPVPVHLHGLSIALHAAHEHLLNLRDFAAVSN